MYDPRTDFLTLIRNAGGVASFAEIPGLDYVVAALARAGLITLSISQTAPIANQPATAWLKPSVPSWVAEGVLFLWNAVNVRYEPATPALWGTLLYGASSNYLFQSASAALNNVGNTTSLLAIQRAAPVVTVIALPSVASRNGKPLQIVDWSTGVANHAIALIPSAGNTVMRLPSWQLLSTPDQLAGITLYPAAELNGWVIAP